MVPTGERGAPRHIGPKRNIVGVTQAFCKRARAWCSVNSGLMDNGVARSSSAGPGLDTHTARLRRTVPPITGCVTGHQCPKSQAECRIRYGGPSPGIHAGRVPRDMNVAARKSNPGTDFGLRALLHASHSFFTRKLAQEPPDGVDVLGGVEVGGALVEEVEAGPGVARELGVTVQQGLELGLELRVLR